MAPQPFSKHVNVLVENIAVRPGEIDEFEYAMRGTPLGKRKKRAQPVLVYNEDFAGFNVANVGCFYKVESTGFRSQHIAAVQLHPDKEA